MGLFQSEETCAFINLKEFILLILSSLICEDSQNAVIITYFAYWLSIDARHTRLFTHLFWIYGHTICIHLLSFATNKLYVKVFIIFIMSSLFRVSFFDKLREIE